MVRGITSGLLLRYLIESRSIMLSFISYSKCSTFLSLVSAVTHRDNGRYLGRHAILRDDPNKCYPGVHDVFTRSLPRSRRRPPIHHSGVSCYTSAAFWVYVRPRSIHPGFLFHFQYCTIHRVTCHQDHNRLNTTKDEKQIMKFKFNYKNSLQKEFGSTVVCCTR